MIFWFKGLDILIILDMFKINKKSGKIGCENKIAIVNLDKCKSNTPAYQYLKRISKVCERIVNWYAC